MAQRDPIRIILLLDGTFQIRSKVKTRFSGITPTVSEGDWFTNVALLAQCITKSSLQPDKNGKTWTQVVFYQSGIGTGAIDFVTKVLEGSTGMSLSYKVGIAYAFLVDNYQPGDEIFPFGFSRGAYTARALAAFLNYAGIMTQTEVAKSFDAIWAAYRKRVPVNPSSVDKAEQIFYKELGRWPSGNAMRSARGNVQATNDLLGTDHEEVGVEQDTDSILTNRYPRVNPPQIKVVGVWDTVGALGIPGDFLRPDYSRYYSFFDPILAPNVDYGFHALALDEDRKHFLPTLWYLPVAGHEIESDAGRREGQVLDQTWVQGSHGDCGGSHAYHGLSDITLAWMISRLVDREGGPLLGIDLEKVKKLQDRRRPWARQPEHPSRWWFEYQSTRNAGWWNMPTSVRVNAIWKDQVEIGNTQESIHYSVHIGNRCDPKTSPQFKIIREKDPEKLTEMWEENKDESSLWPTEKALMWKRGQASFVPDSAYLGDDDDAELSIGAYSAGQDIDDEKTTDPEIGVQKPGIIPEEVWQVAKFTANVPIVALAAVVNFGFTPTRNLKPGVLVQGVAKLQSLLNREPKTKKA